MNKLVIILVFILSIICIDNIVLSQVSDNSTVVSLIVDINGNNEYPLNGYCGNQTFACNTIVDAVNYFSTIKNVQSTTTYSSYQQLELLLADGKYNFSSICFNMYQFNLTISPLTIGSQNVLIDGWYGNGVDPCFLVTPPVAGTPDSNSIGSFSLFTNINFNNFQQPIFQVKTNSSFTNIQFESCTFFQFNAQNTIMIDINSEFTTNLTNPNSNLVFNNTRFNIIHSSAPVIVIVNTNVYFNVSSLVNGSFESFLNSTYSNVTIQCSEFTFISTSYGIITSLNSNVSIVGTTFKDGTGLCASVLTFNSNLLTNTFSIVNSNFNGNTGKTYGGVIYSKNSNLDFSTVGGTIVNSNFNESSASWGGVIYSSNIPLSITNSTFIGNTASTYGGDIYIEGSTMDIVNTTFTQSSSAAESSKVSTVVDSTELLGQVIYAYYSTVSIIASTFDSEFSETIYCLQSTININSTTVFNPSSLTCSNSCAFVLDVKEICQSVTTGGTSTSGTGTGTGSTGNGIITISSTHSSTSTSTTGSTSPKLNIKSSIILSSFIFGLILFFK